MEASNHAMTLASDIREVWQFREVIKNFVSQDLKVRYRRSFLGFFWSLLNPLLHMAVITLVFSIMFRFPMGQYALYVLSGLVPWSFWASSIDGCCLSIVRAEGMLKRQYFPKMVFPISVIMQNLVTFFLSLLVLLLVLAPITGFTPSKALLILPLSFLCVVAVSLGAGLIASVATVYFRDIQHLVSVFMSAWFYLTPIIYPLEVPANHPTAPAAISVGAAPASPAPGEDQGPIPHKYRHYFKLNPMFAIVQMFHRPIYDGMLPTASEIAAALGVAAASFSLGLTVFRRYQNSLIFSL
jgi:ABC-type polysaccharide/polyol phosphate export permease